MSSDSGSACRFTSFLPPLGSKPPGTEAIFHIITANLPDELSELKEITEFLSTCMRENQFKTQEFAYSDFSNRKILYNLL